ncbi:MAG TPA: hypothetical protein VIL86_06955 [Tepidisphaeraceae bacterium]|jgi:hypothetical protein
MSAPAGEIRFELAGERHDAGEGGIRALLRETAMEGDIALSLQREPSYFAAARQEGGEHRAIVAVDSSGRVICAGGISIRQRFYNGALCRVGYLGQLRLARSHAGRFDILRRGYASFHDLHPSLDLEACFTAIATDNIRARRLLERGISGLPRYDLAGELVTLLIPTRSVARASRPCPRINNTGETPVLQDFPSIQNGIDDLAAVWALLRRNAAEFQFAPSWDEPELSRLLSTGGLRKDSFRILSNSTGPVAYAALWDQRPFKQAVVAHYSRRLSLLRPFYNLFAAFTGRVPLPPPHQTIAQAFVSPLAVPLDRPQWLIQLLLLLTASARTLGMTAMTLALDARDPRLPSLLQRFRPHLYRTRLYTVSWPDEPPRVEPPDGRLLYPEVALL